MKKNSEKAIIIYTSRNAKKHAQRALILERMHYMKRFGKTIGLVLCFIMMLALSCGVIGLANAAETSAATITFDSATVKCGDEFTIEVKASGMKGAQCGNIEARIDTDKLEVVSAKGGAIGTTGFVAGRAQDDPGLLTIAFAALESIEEDDGVIARFTLKAKADGEVEIDPVVIDWSSEDYGKDTDAVKAESGIIAVTSGAESDVTPAVDEKTDGAEAAPSPEYIPSPDLDLKGDGKEQGDGKDSKDSKDTKDVDEKAEAAAKAIKDAGAKSKTKVAQTGDNAVAVIAGLMAIGAVGFVASKKKRSE